MYPIGKKNFKQLCGDVPLIAKQLSKYFFEKTFPLQSSLSFSFCTSHRMCYQKTTAGVGNVFFYKCNVKQNLLTAVFSNKQMLYFLNCTYLLYNNFSTNYFFCICNANYINSFCPIVYLHSMARTSCFGTVHLYPRCVLYFNYSVIS